MSSGASTSQIQLKHAMKRPKQWKSLNNIGFILFEKLGVEQSINILQTSASQQGFILKTEFEVTSSGKHECVVYIDNKKYASVEYENNKKDAKTQAFDQALEYARRHCYTIKQKESINSVNVNCDNTTKKNLKRSNVIMRCQSIGFR